MPGAQAGACTGTSAPGGPDGIRPPSVAYFRPFPRPGAPNAALAGAGCRPLAPGGGGAKAGTGAAPTVPEMRPKCGRLGSVRQVRRLRRVPHDAGRQVPRMKTARMSPAGAARTSRRWGFGQARRGESAKTCTPHPACSRPARAPAGERVIRKARTSNLPFITVHFL